MKDFNEHIKTPLGCFEDKKVGTHRPQYTRTARQKKVVPAKKAEKTYKVTVTYIQLTEGEVKIKRAIIESIIKKSCKI